MAINRITSNQQAAAGTIQRQMNEKNGAGWEINGAERVSSRSLYVHHRHHDTRYKVGQRTVRKQRRQHDGREWFNVGGTWSTTKLAKKASA